MRDKNRMTPGKANLIDAATLTRGDIVVLTDPQGLWIGQYEYLKPDRESPGRIIVRDLGESKALYSVRVDCVRQPTVLGIGDVEVLENLSNSPDSVSPPAAGVQAHADQPITASQRRLLFALAKERGFDIDDLRAMTPEGSISKLTQRQATAMIDALRGPSGEAPEWSARGTATAKQLGKIVHLRNETGFSETEFSTWLQKWFQVGSVREIDDGRLASRVIGGLTRMRDHRRKAAQRDAGHSLEGASKAV